MANPFRTSPTQYSISNMNNYRQIYQSLVNNKNPMQLFEQLAKNNPQYNNILNALRSGQNPQVLFETLCRQKGIDPQEFIKQIQG